MNFLMHHPPLHGRILSHCTPQTFPSKLGPRQFVARLHQISWTSLLSVLLCVPVLTRLLRQHAAPSHTELVHA